MPDVFVVIVNVFVLLFFVCFSHFNFILSLTAFYGRISCIHCQMIYDLQIKFS